jgi:hypothetical protein
MHARDGSALTMSHEGVASLSLAAEAMIRWTTLSKTCPKCALVHPPSAMYCECGYDFIGGRMNSRHASRVQKPPPVSSTLAHVGLRFAVVACIGILLRLLLTVVGVPIGRWYFLAAGFGIGGFLASLPRLRTLSRSRALLVAATCFTLVILGLGSPWNSRDRFLGEFNRVEVGMTKLEVDALLQKYMRGTGIPNFRSVTTITVGSRTHANAPSAAQLSPEGCQVYRHSSSGFWNADWGTVCYRADRVVSTDFSPD